MMGNVSGTFHLFCFRRSSIYALLFQWNFTIIIKFLRLNGFFFDALNRMEFLSNLEQFQCNKISRKTLFYLISTLNASFNPDYDFSHCRGEEFSREPCIKVRFPLCLSVLFLAFFVLMNLFWKIFKSNNEIYDSIISSKINRIIIFFSNLSN